MNNTRRWWRRFGQAVLLGRLRSALRRGDAPPETEASFHTLAHLCPAVIVIVRPSADGKSHEVPYVNPAFEALTGYTLQDMGRMDPFMLVHPDHLESAARALKAALEMEPPQPVQIETPIVAKSGEQHGLRFTLNRVTYVGRPAVMATAFNAAEHRRTEQALRSADQEKEPAPGSAEAALRESEARYRTIVEGQTELICCTRPDGTLVFVNQAYCDYFGQSRKELLGRSITCYVPEQDRALVEQHFLSLTPENPAATLEHRVMLPDGQIRWQQWTNRATFGEAGNLVEFQSVGRDVTRRKEAEDQRLALEIERERVRVLENFIGDVSHDLRTPLTTVKFSLYLLDKLAKTDKQRHYLAILGSQIAHLEGLLESMINLSRLDKETELALEPVNVADLIYDIAVRQSDLARRKGLGVTVIREDTPPPPIMADASHLEHALTNVLVNALQYTPEGGTVTLRAYQQADQVVIEVQDTGIGIGPEDLPHIFDRFYRADKARGAHIGGAGLGLAIAKKIVERHHGHITVVSEPDQGSTFRIFLPIHLPEGSTA